MSAICKSLFEETCSSFDIKEVNEKKQYTLTATSLLHTILTDTNLTASAVKIWQYLYTKSTYNSDLSIQISYNTLAQVFKKSARTIIRAVNSLKLRGYLKIRHNISRDGQGSNTIYVRFPKHHLNEIKAFKNRTKSFNKDNIDSNVEQTSLMMKEPKIEERKSYQAKNDPISNNKYNINIELINKRIKDTENQLKEMYLNPPKKGEYIQWFEKVNKMHEFVNTHKLLIEKTINCKFESNSDKNVMPGCDNNDIDNNISKTNILNNKHSSSTTDNINPQRKNANAVYFLNLLPKKVNIYQRNKISDGLKSMGFEGNANTNLTKQIIFAIEQDSLRDKPINHGINIALKLVRTKRWTTPCGIRNMQND